MVHKLVLPCLRGVIGDWVYYSTLMSAQQIAEWVKPAKDIRESKKLDEILQRDLNNRKKGIAKYLLTDNSRFFNSIIVGVFEGVPDWAEFDLSKTNELIGSSEDKKIIKESIGLMLFNGDEKMFAIDGQHRVAGITEAYKEDTNRELKDDQFSVIFVAHIDNEEGRKRTRKLFSDINKNAKPVSGGDKLKIDERDLTAIVTRKLYAEYKYFEEGNLISLTEQGNLDKGDVKHFTNLLGLDKANKILKELLPKNKDKKEWDSEIVDNLFQISNDFFDFIIQNIDDYRKFFIEKTTKLDDLRKNNTNILFRPIGLVLIANLYVYFKKENNLEFFKENINKITFSMPESKFNGILWNDGKMEAKTFNQNIAFTLAKYLLGKVTDAKELSKLEQNYQSILKNINQRLPEKIITFL